jgi:competence protein ComFC
MAQSLINTARSALKPVLDLIYPSMCGGCGTEGAVLCNACIESFSFVESDKSCPVCGRQTGVAIVCGECLAHRKRYFTRSYFGFHFEGFLRESLHAFKFQGRKDVGRTLAGLLDEGIRGLAPQIDCIVPLPITEKRLKERGFNQSFIIAEEISKRTGKPIEFGTLIKVKETKDQYTLSKEERKKNVKNAFTATGTHLKGRNILLVDDLYTTGNTAREASKALFHIGVKTVALFALARTPA